MTDRDLLELIAEKVMNLDEKVMNMDERLGRVEANQIRIENDHGAKLAALFDGQQQLSNKLDRIEAEVTRHDKFILERIK